MRQQNRRIAMILTAAVTGVLAAGMAWAQVRVGSDGRALDANRQVGSGGLNSTVGNRLPPSALGNNIVNGNVTGGREFRGNVPYSDPGAFHGTTAGTLSDDFVRGSSSGTVNNAQIIQPFYAGSRAVPPPAGFVQQSYGQGAFVAAPPPVRKSGDMRPGVLYDTSSLPLPGRTVLQNNGFNGGDAVLTMDPLTGVRQWDAQTPEGKAFLANSYDIVKGTTMDPGKLKQMQQDLTEPEDSPLGSSLNSGSLTSNPLVPGALNSGAIGNDAVSNSVDSQNMPGTTANRRQLKSASQQSTQYAQLQNRLKESQTGSQNKAGSTSQMVRTERIGVKPDADGNKTNPDDKQPGTGAQQSTMGMGNNPPMGVGPDGGNPLLRQGNALPPEKVPAGTDANKTTPPSNVPPSSGDPKDRPIQIHSLATGVESKSLSEVLADAESLMKEGKYGSAMDQYNGAASIAPNNPLILIGKANVELAQSYYSRAEADLRQAFLQDQALLMGQYDLKAWFPAERLDYVRTDLKAIANQDQKQVKPVFLLAYIAYNTGNERLAAGYLDLAEKRAGTSDPLFAIVRKHWSLPAADAPAPEQNK